ncbi:MAG: hypothetical protein K2L55_05230 [Muribaculaceae bacterium]|nr:hypothetical protein [Muribaculaceae bacterium]
MKILSTIFFTLISFAFSANAINIEGQPSILQDCIKNIEYNYQLFNRPNGRLDCSGELTVLINVPDRCQKILFYRSKPYIINIEDFKIFGSVSQFQITEPISEKEITIPDMRWGTYFRIRFVLDDDTEFYSSLYCTSSYIEKNDLDAIFETSSAESIINNPVNISIVNSNILIETIVPTDFIIAYLNGSILFSGKISSTISIPINNTNSSIIIVRYKINNRIITKKFILE